MFFFFPFSMLITPTHRIWPPSLPPLFRDGPSSRHLRPGSQDATFPQSHELSQGMLPGFDESTRPRDDCSWPWQEARRCTQGLLRWCHPLDSQCVQCTNLCIINTVHALHETLSWWLESSFRDQIMPSFSFTFEVVGVPTCDRH